MCGIAGHLSFDRPPDDLSGMLEMIAHRGPDDWGTHHDGPVRLGFRRLAIVDLSPAGHQPMTNEDGTIWLVFNGEIYNYHELVETLKGHGHHFRSHTDSEAIIHGYEQWGVDCLRRFNGMFALALWDGRTQTLFCARDRFGVKPFYYARTGADGGLIFASEIKALLRHPRALRRAAAPQMIYDFLTAGSLDHTEHTCFAGIDQLPAAHMLLATRQGLRIDRYWDIPDNVDTGARHDLEQPTLAERRRYAEEFGALLEDSVRLRLHADVPVGTCLSGGLDSSSIVCLANRLLFGTDAPGGGGSADRGARQKTFSACYEDSRHDERSYIEQVLAATGAEANYTFPGQELPIEEVIPKVVWQQDEPFGSTSILAQWHVMRAARARGVTVLLDGQGADELLGGYHGYFGASLADSLAALRLGQFGRDLLLYRRYHHPSLSQVGRATMHGLLPPQSAPRELARLARLTMFGERAAPGWLTPEFAGAHRLTQPWQEWQGSRLSTLLYNQATRSSLPALLHYEDRNSMAFAIEARTPFLDYRLAECAFRLPNASHIGHGVTKVVLRDAMRGILPEPVRIRMDKKGFSTPEDQWFRTSLRDWAREILHSRTLAERGFVAPGAAQAVFERHVAGEVNESVLIWRILNVELWARTFLDGQPVAP